MLSLAAASDSSLTVVGVRERFNFFFGSLYRTGAPRRRATPLEVPLGILNFGINRRVYRSILKKFLDWSNQNNLFQKEKKESPKNSLRLQEAKGNARQDWTKNNYRGQKHKKPYMLEARHRDKSLIYPNDYINVSLQNDLDEYIKFRMGSNCSQPTIDGDIRTIKQILGWKHRYQGIPLSDLRLTTIIPYVKLITDNYGEEKIDWNDYAAVQFKLKHEAIKSSKKALVEIEEFLKFLDTSPITQLRYWCTLVSVAKFVFRHETGSDEYVNHKDLPIIKLLLPLGKMLKDKAKTVKPNINYEEKSVHWIVALKVLERLRNEADMEQNLINQPRKGSAEIESLQNFLSLAFMTIIPPLRARVFYELEIGRTLVKGIYQNGSFIPEEKLPAFSDAKWYIHLMTDDYKTGKAYGEWWSNPIPNIKYPDGKYFYEYIDRWLKEGRNHKKQCDHNFFFRGKITYKQLDSSNWNRRILHSFLRLTGVAVSPKELRKMFVTYLKDEGATETQLEAAATAMQHSRLMQSKIYDQQEHFNKIAPMLSFNQKAIEEAWNSIDNLKKVA